MIKFKAEGIKYKCKTSWSEITFGEWKQLNKTKDNLEILEILTGLPKDIIERLGDKSQFNLSVAISFVYTPLKIEDYKAPKEFKINQRRKIPYVEDIKEKEYGQKIYFQHSLTENKDDLEKMILESALIYSQPYIDKGVFELDRLDELKNSLDNVFFVDLYSIAIAYSKQLKSIIDTEASELKSEPTYEQKIAGVDMFSRFGVMNTVKALASNDILNYDKVLRIEYNTVFIHLLINKTETKYQERYRKVLENKR
jgi:hypothetical protein